eukprot:scaffold15163_cov125-Isochrysis_galbana.AAC.2
MLAGQWAGFVAPRSPHPLIQSPPARLLFWSPGASVWGGMRCTGATDRYSRARPAICSDTR